MWNAARMTEGTADARSRLVRATLDLIGEAGVGRVTNRSVAQAAGVSLGTVTYHFDTQADLLREALGRFLAEETARLGELSAAVRSAELTVDEGVAALQALLEDRPLRRVAKFELYLQAARDPALRPAARRCFKAYDDLAVATLRTLGVPDPERAAPLTIAIVDGLQLRRLATGGRRLPIAEPLKALLQALRTPA